jgi:pyruvate formate lyase activating enzyme
MSPATFRTKSSLQVGGITPLTTIDYPDELAAVVFCQGCPWRCRYCHNGGLLNRNSETGYRWPDVLSKLKQRTGLLDAVVFSGGEPTLQAGLADAINDVKQLGMKTGLHTAGCYPDRLEKLLPMFDWIGLDIKALSENYTETTGVTGSGKKAWESLLLLAESETDFEVRITVHSGLLAEEKLMTLLQRLAGIGIENIALQHCNTDSILDQQLGLNHSELVNSACIDYLEQHFNKVTLRTP